jgi:predicted alpha-1,2-mannosidase
MIAPGANTSIAIAALLLATAGQAAAGPADRVDPFIGTDGTGHTFPGPSRPFGMVQPGPDNAEHGWDYASGYQYRAPKILGFSQTRASGTGIPELGDILLQPTGRWRGDDFVSGYDKASETARAGYYAVRLTDNDARVELTASLRVAMHRYAFDHGGRVWVLADFEHGLKFVSGERVTASAIHVGRDRIEGWVTSRNWTTRTLAFSLRFDHPIAQIRRLPDARGAHAPRYALAFNLGSVRRLQVKIAPAGTDVAGARRNLAEIPGWDFDAVARAAHDDWDHQLGRIEIAADPIQQRVFYTALYHALLHPSVYSDLDGRYRGPDGRIHIARGGVYYSTMSLWDIFRAGQPLDALVAPERVNDIVLSLLDHGQQAGYLPLWPIWGGETNTMIGNPALPVIASAWARGFRGFDGREALAAMVKSSTEDHPLSAWSIYDRYGYYPFDKVDGEAVSRTLEAGVGDDAVARLAGDLGETATATRFAARAQAWKTLTDPGTHLMRGKDSAGAWRTPFDPLQVTSPLNHPGDYTEANAWQYSFAPGLYDPEGLVQAMGGRAAFSNMLDRFFGLETPSAGAFLGQEAMIGQYAHGNEPSHHIAWLYDWSDSPWRGQERVREIATRFYGPGPGGILGNEDAGQLSAWYVFATLGFYPAQPSSGDYVLGAPLVSHAVVHLAGGHDLVIDAPGASAARPYATAWRWNGRPAPGFLISHKDLAAGGTLTFQMESSHAP